jgi:Protein of unknown function (DUF3800)
MEKLKMYIFIDESGQFIWSENPLNPVCCVGALVIADKNLEGLTIGFEALSWKKNCIEIKGNELKEEEIIDVLRLLSNHDALLKVSSIDMKMHRDEYVTQLKMEQAQGLVGGLTSEHKASLIAELEGKAKALRETPNQLFIQGMLLIDLMEHVIRDAFQYWALRDQSELGIFRWVVDGKELNKTTKFESLWNSLTAALVTMGDQGISKWEGVDYSGFVRYERKIPRKPPNFELIPEDEQPVGVDIALLLSDLSFQDSKKIVGLQLVDVAVNAFRRVVNGNLNEKVCQYLGNLMLTPGEDITRLLRFNSVPEFEVPSSSPYKKTLNLIRASVRPMLTPEYARWLGEQMKKK